MSDFTSIYISGNLISYDLLERFDRDLEHVSGQKAKDFGLDSAVNMRQEINRAWEDASRQWLTFKSRKERLKETDKGTTETRTHWMMPFFSILNYNLEFQKEAEVVGEKLYEISHRDLQRDSFPVLIISYRDALDKKPEASRLRMSPHALLQDYLNNTEHIFGLVTNGLQLRLLRDTGRISKPVYAEFNLEKIFEESLYAEFVLLYRLLHASRMPQRRDLATESIVEQYHQDAIESGGRIRNQLSKAMEHSIKALAKGLVQHPLNNELRQQIADGKLNEEKFYRVLLRLIYRILFLMTIEERRLVYPENADVKTQQLSNIYDLCFAIERLRKLSAVRHRIDGKQHDLWVRLLQTLQLFEDEKLAKQLGLHALGTGLFTTGAIIPFDECKIANGVLLQAIFRLSFFENENKTMQRINYRQLDVEEFGSVYEGLLDYKISFEKALPHDAARWDISLQSSSERGKSGTHYTPEELVQPLIKHSLDYLIANRKKIIDEKIKSRKLSGNANKEAREKLVEENLLTLKVCDVACGSGHILISAARRIAEACASIIEEEEQPNPSALRKAKRDVIRHCIYGVDMNPMAVELCKVALWLEAHNPCEPLNFLDHHIKCGDAIVGLTHRDELENGIADEAFKTLPDDDKAIASAFLKRNKSEIKQRKQVKLDFEEDYNSLFDNITAAFDLWRRLPEKTPDDIKAKQRQYEKITTGAQQWKVKALADIMVAQFFLPKTKANKEILVTDAEYQKHYHSKSSIQTTAAAHATSIALTKKFFHWFIEFPEVFEQNGFNCILGNPPFLGGARISGTYGDDYLNWLKYEYSPAGSVDIVTYFFRRIFSIIKENGFQSLISTNTIAQGNSREGGLEVIEKEGGSIIHALRSMKWPGRAAVEVALITIHKGEWNGYRTLDNRFEDFISTYLDNVKSIGNPYSLIENEHKSFKGSEVVGDGFFLSNDEAKRLIELNSINKEAIFPFFSGDDLNSSFNQSPSKISINFFRLDLETCQNKYPLLLELLVEKVKPGRDKNSDKRRREIWWQYSRPTIDMYKAISALEEVIVVSLTTKFYCFDFCPSEYVFGNSLIVISSQKRSLFSILQSSIHCEWGIKYSSTLESRLRYVNTDTFETFPFPQNISAQLEQELAKIGEQYHLNRRKLMLHMQLGLTKTYNLFHLKSLTSIVIEVRNKQPREVSEKAYQDILKLRQLHTQMDEAVLAAYGWQDIALLHDFYEVDYLSENDRVRFTIHPDARKEILKRLLELNHKIHKQEVEAGLWDKKKAKKKEEGIVAGPEGDYGIFKSEE